MERMGAAMLGAAVKDPVIFEAVGVPGMLQSLIADAPPHSRIVVVGVCMHTDRIEPFMAVTKELELRFSFGYTPDEFAATLARLAAGVPGADLLITSAVDLSGAPGAFETLRAPAAEAVTGATAKVGRDRAPGAPERMHFRKGTQIDG